MRKRSPKPHCRKGMLDRCRPRDVWLLSRQPRSRQNYVAALVRPPRCKPCLAVKIAELGVLPDIVRMDT